MLTDPESTACHSLKARQSHCSAILLDQIAERVSQDRVEELIVTAPMV
jgi:hypothetical protein